MVHGRGATPEDILRLAEEINRTGFACLAPRAANRSWYPYSFLAPLEDNEPGISSGLQSIADLFKVLGEHKIPPERTILLGFSQGACLSLEFAARNTRRYGGIVGLSGGLIGPDGTPRDYPGSLDGTPVFLGCSDVDPHIPKDRVIESGEIFARLGAQVTTRLYPNMGHTVNHEELKYVRKIVDSLSGVSGV